MYVKNTPPEVSCWPAAPTAMGVLGFHGALPAQLSPDKLESRSYSAPASLHWQQIIVLILTFFSALTGLRITNDANIYW